MSLPTPSVSFSKEALDKIEHLKTRYPDVQAACLPVLHVAQDEFGYLPDAAIDLVAEVLGLRLLPGRDFADTPMPTARPARWSPAQPLPAAYSVERATLLYGDSWLCIFPA